MRKLFFSAAFGLIVFATSAQVFNIGPRVGFSSYDLKTRDFGFYNKTTFQNFKVNISNASTGYHAGLFTQINMGSLFLMPEVSFRTMSMQYTWEDLNLKKTNLSTQDFLYLDIPIMLGIKVLKIFRFQAGPNARIILQNHSDLSSWSDFEQRANKTTLGYQAGFGLDIKRLAIDLRHDGNLSNTGNNIKIGNQVFDFDSRLSSTYVSLGYRMFRK